MSRFLGSYHLDFHKLLIISGEGIESPASTSSAFTTSILPSPFLANDFISKKNYLGLFIEHKINFSDCEASRRHRLSIEFDEGREDEEVTERSLFSTLWFQF